MSGGICGKLHKARVLTTFAVLAKGQRRRTKDSPLVFLDTKEPNHEWQRCVFYTMHHGVMYLNQSCIVASGPCLFISLPDSRGIRGSLSPLSPLPFLFSTFLPFLPLSIPALRPRTHTSQRLRRVCRASAEQGDHDHPRYSTFTASWPWKRPPNFSRSLPNPKKRNPVS